jgi:hypothetical protein
MGTSKGRGKQWQTIPKNLSRIQRARAIPALVPAKTGQGLNPTTTTTNNNNNNNKDRVSWSIEEIFTDNTKGIW